MPGFASIPVTLQTLFKKQQGGGGGSDPTPRRSRGNPRPCKGVDATPPHEFFWNGFRTAGRIALKFCIAYGASFAQLLAKKLTGSGQVTEL